MCVFRRKKDVSLTEENKSQFMDTLTSIRNILTQNSSFEQSEVINNIICLLENNDYKNFKKALNDRDVWGSSGAVWETYITKEENKMKFQEKIVSLISLMKSSSLLEVNIGAIKKAYLR